MIKKKLEATKAEMGFSVARFMLKKHKNPLLNRAAKAASWLNKKRYGKDALDFLDEPPSADSEF
ncbi:hypothetical protein A9Q81_06515 [Gammaproteobacteria bacterium 42_54_T18]|nr:hypothetical protein A9Q81_06515 [Gammaproteobacteria bacterium 42_54_T18]